MADLNISQHEADYLLALKKVSCSNSSEIFPSPGAKLALELESQDGKEKFILDLGRGRIKTAKVKYQTRGRAMLVLARVDLYGAPHRNPDGEIVQCPHIHTYREGFGDKWAQALPLGIFSKPDDAWQVLLDFFGFCNITNPPNIERGVSI